MSYENILYNVEDRIATITLNRPDRRSALSFGLRAAAIRRNLTVPAWLATEAREE